MCWKPLPDVLVCVFECVCVCVFCVCVSVCVCCACVQIGVTVMILWWKLFRNTAAAYAKCNRVFLTGSATVVFLPELWKYWSG